MRSIFILRGAPGSGKSTWVKENDLESYAIGADTIRLMYQSPVTTISGERIISQQHDKEVWELVLQLIEKRMQNGELIIVDATHYKSVLINKYKDLITKYRYRAYVVDFSDISEEELIERNKHRGFRNVPAETITKMVVALKDINEVKKAYKLITPQEAANMINSPLIPFDVNNYEKVVVFGDIHGCYNPLKEYFDKNPFNENYNYIFCGDYLDRGLQNKEVLEFFISLKDKKNCVFIEGNHEKWLRLYADKDYDIEDYLKKDYNYDDPFVIKIIAKLRDKANKLEKQIRLNNNKSEELNKLLQEAWQTDPGTKEVYYEFEQVDVGFTQFNIKQENSKLKDQLDKLYKYMQVLSHEKHNTKNYIDHILEQYKEMFEQDLSLDISNILETKFNLFNNIKENPIKSHEFIYNTYHQIKDIDKSEIRRFLDRLAQMSYFTFNGNNYLVTHAGVPSSPTLKTQSIELIKGVGSYSEHELVDKNFVDNVNDKIDKITYSIHGHRNPLGSKLIQSYNNSLMFNLEGNVEFGGQLRILEISKEDNDYTLYNPIEIKNDYYRKPEEEVVEEKSDLEILKEMYKSKWIERKHLKDNILSLNFTRDAFYKGRWDTLTCQARGLFVDVKTGQVRGRSFNKFHNYKQVEYTEPAYMKQHLVFPVIGYKKENGFLGIISKSNNEILFFTKSTNTGSFVNWFIGTLCDTFKISPLYTFPYLFDKSYFELYDMLENDKENNNIKHMFEKDKENNNIKQMLKWFQDSLKNYLIDKLEDNHSYVFECVDPINDPHIIKYDKPQVFLLEVFKNQLKEETKTYEQLIDIANELKVPVKQKELIFNNWEEFEDWKNKFRHGVTQWDCKHEGYVLEDQNHFRVKFKSTFYSWWKEMRAIKRTIQKGKPNRKIYKTKEEIQLVKLMESMDREELNKMNMFDLQDLFYKTYNCED